MEDVKQTWFEQLYFQKGVTYATLEQYEQEHAVGNQTGYFMPKPSHLLYTIPVCALMCMLKIILQAYAFPWLGLKLGCPARPDKNRLLQEKNSVYRTLYEHNRRLLRIGHVPSQLYVDNRLVPTSVVAKQLGIDEKRLGSRLRKVHNLLTRHTAVEKFSDCAWRYFVYLSMFCYGCVVLHDQTWLSDPNLCWANFPYQLISPRLFWYYTVEMAFYMSLSVSQFTDVRRKDFWQMLIHHIITLSLLYNSYMGNAWRIGSLVLLLHDSADILLDQAKMLKYANLHSLSNVTIVCFVLVWLFTRLYLYPVYLVWPLWFLSYPHTLGRVMYLYLVLLLNALQVLHVMWTVMIFHSVYSIAKYGESGKDARSDSEPETLSVGDDDESEAKCDERATANGVDDQASSACRTERPCANGQAGLVQRSRAAAAPNGTLPNGVCTNGTLGHSGDHH